jgi:hypothetical protein
MNTKLKIVAQLAAAIAFIFCLIAGLYILSRVGFKSNDDAVWTAIGLYFIGKAFFVGPMLLVAAEQLGRMRTTDRAEPAD